MVGERYTLAEHSQLVRGGRFCLTEIVNKVVLQKKVSAQTRQLILIIANFMNKLTDLCGNELSQNVCIYTFCEIILLIGGHDFEASLGR